MNADKDQRSVFKVAKSRLLYFADITRDSKLVYQCAGHDNGSITVTGGNDDIIGEDYGRD